MTAIHNDNNLSNNNNRPRNLVLAALPNQEYQRLLPHLKPVELTQGKVLEEEGVPPQWVYFLDSGLASVVMTSQDGHEVEVTMTGDEGILCSRVILGDSPNIYRVLMQVSGEGYRLPVKVFKEECQGNGQLQKLALAHINQMLTDTSQCALCNRLHTIEQRLCRWLLMVRDRIQDDELALTQEFISDMLGTGRPGVSLAIGELARSGLIRHSRGCVVILDADAMEETACECYTNIRTHYDMLVRQLLSSRAEPSRAEPSRAEPSRAERKQWLENDECMIRSAGL